MGVPRSAYYRWQKPRHPRPRGPSWRALSPKQRQHVLQTSDEWPELSPRVIAVMITGSGLFSVSKSTACSILKAAGKIPRRPEDTKPAAQEYSDKPEHVHDRWQAGLTNFFIPAWGHHHDGGVQDGRSPFLLHHDLRADEKAGDVIDVFEGAAAFAKQTHGYVARRLVTDHGKWFEAADTGYYLTSEASEAIGPIFARSYHPRTLGELERLRRTMMEHVDRHVHDSHWQVTRAIDRFYRYYNYERYHEALANDTPADVYLGRAERILKRRGQVKAQPMQQRRKLYEAWRTCQADLKQASDQSTVSAGRNQGDLRSSLSSQTVPNL